MLAILFYCLKVLLCSGLLFGYYLLALRNKQFHGWNRYYLLFAVLLSFIIPFIKIPILFSGHHQDPSLILRGLQFANWGDEIIIRPNNYWQINWQNVGIISYLMISLFFVFQLLKTIVWINKISRENPSKMLDDVQFYNTAEAGTPFSFFKKIFWHKAIEPNSSKGLQMLQHELTHVYQWHSADKMLLEITTILMWWNPFFHLIKKELSTIHEFIADQQAANNDDHLQYASLLLSKAFGSNHLPITNPFFQSQLKRRIIMLTTIKTPKFNYLRRLMVLPLAAGTVMLFAFKYEKTIDNNVKKSATQITVVIDAGHGGDDDGAIGINGLKEKDINLAIAKEIAALAKTRNINVVLTRNTDELPGAFNNVNAALRQRVNIASNSNADLFISLHVNSGLKGENKNGIGAFIAAKNENNLIRSQIFASALLDELTNSGLSVMRNINQRKDKGVWVLDANPLPAVLLELGFITNEGDAAFISNPKNQEKMANEILDAIVKIAPSIKNQSTVNAGILNKNLVNSYFPDSIKDNGANAKGSLNSGSPIFYNGEVIKKIIITDIEKGCQILTKSGKTFILTKKEIERQIKSKDGNNFDINTIDNFVMVANKTNNNQYDVEMKTRENKYSQSLIMDDKIPTKPMAGDEEITVNADATIINSGSITPKPLYIIDGEIAKENALKSLNPNQIKSINVLKGKNAINKYGDDGRNGAIEVILKIPITYDPTITNGFYQDSTKAQHSKDITPAQFPGGVDGWRRYLERNLQYPEAAQKKNIQGVVRLQLTVTEDGNVQDVKALNNPGGGLAEEAERVIKYGPKWVPAKKNGKVITYRFVQTLTFQLQ